MNNKKSTKRTLLTSMLSLVLCMAMLVGTTFAWFTDEVTSSGNIIKSGKLEVTMDWAEGNEDPAAANWKDASKGAIFNSELWEPGYTEAKHIKVSNVGTLALRYQMRILANGIVSELADVIDVYYFAEATQLDRAKLATGTKLGTLSEVLNNTNANAISKTIVGDLVAGASKTVTIALKMQESAGNEYQNLSIGTDFSIQLLATQLTSENDSFDNTYDANAEFAAQEVPAAMVKKLTGNKLDIYDAVTGENVTLDTGYQFEPTETAKQAEQSEQRYWIADFAVSADKDVAANSMMLAGYYKAYADYIKVENGWIGMTSDKEIEAGQEILLLDAMGFPVNYEEICAWGNDGTGFRCGAVDLDGTNAGTTITVELRLYETYSAEEAKEKFGDHSTNYKKADYEADADVVKYYTTIGTFSYTFGAWEVSTSEELAEAINAGVPAIELADGEYKLPSAKLTTDAAIKISGSKKAVIDLRWGAYLENATLSFEGLSFKTGTGYVTSNGVNFGSDYAALYSKNVTYTNCAFSGPMRIGRDGASFIGCTFSDLGNDYVWTYGNAASFEGCTFNTDGKALLIYNDGGTAQPAVTVKNCTFNATKGAKAGAIANQNCAAIEIHNYGNGVALTTSGNKIDSDFSGEWRIKTYETTRGGAISVNGVTYTTIALDGKTMTIDANKNVTVNN